MFHIHNQASLILHSIVLPLKKPVHVNVTSIHLRNKNICKLQKLEGQNMALDSYS